MNLRKHLDLQLEQLMDNTAATDEPSIIVRMGSAGTSYRNRASREAIAHLRLGNLGASARDLLPKKRRRTRRAAGESTRSTRDQARRATVSALKKNRQTMLTKAIKASASVVQKKGSNKRGVSASKASAAGPQFFWSSQSIVLSVSRDRIPEILGTMPGAQDIYLNRKLLPPAYSEAKQLPESIRDNKTSSWGLQAINALAAWGAYGIAGNEARVAVLDTGIDANHVDLQGRVAGWAEFNSSGALVPDSVPHDTDEHGTHVAGTIAGGGESGLWIGVAPEAEIYAGLVLDGAVGGTDAQVLAGIDWAIEQSVDVINMSLGGLTLGPQVPNTYSQAIVNALLAGIPVVAAIGNEGSQTAGLPGNELFSFAVGATDYRDRPAGFSGGRTQILTDSPFVDPNSLPLPYSKPDVSAPGVAITSSVPGDNWKTFNGTSMATPHVSGAIALLISALDLTSVNGSDRAFLLQRLLSGSVEELGEAGQDHRFGLGRIDVLRALGYASELGYLR